MTTKTKRNIYLVFSSFLGLEISAIFLALVERNYINELLSSGQLPVVLWGRNGFFPLSLTIIILALGIIFGYIVGIRWWKIVYIEKKHWCWKKRKRRKYS